MKKKSRHPDLIRNPISLIGILLAVSGFISGITLIAVDSANHFQSPYVGIFTYMVIPAILIGGLLLILVGVLLEQRRRRRHDDNLPHLPMINLNDPKHFFNFIVVVSVSLLFLVISGVGSYRAYHFTESITFCGITCHEVMKPEYTAYQNSPHAHTGCTKCHIGPGADFFVKAKVNGIRQVFSTLTDKYSRPIASPVHNLRPAKETCHTCHWPAKFVGATEMTRTYFRADEENSPWTIQMLLNVGGGHDKNRPAKGIHWHVAEENKIEYIAGNEKRTDIPWVRMTDKDGKQTIFQTNEKKKQLTPEQIASAEIRTMDCLDCHNRPSHQYRSPERALNDALASGLLDPALPKIKLNGVEALTGEYETEEQALASIKEKLTKAYPDGGSAVEKAIAGVQEVFRLNFFPEMKVSWKEYPDHIGHMITPGCFRCHNGDHQNPQGQTITRECNSCHTIIAQGPGMDITSINTGGLEFKHPEDIDEEWKETRCDDCHEGLPVM